MRELRNPKRLHDLNPNAALELDLYGKWDEWTSWSERDRIWQRTLTYEANELEFMGEEGGGDLKDLNPKDEV